MTTTTKKNYYDLLGVDVNASKRVIQKRYQTLNAEAGENTDLQAELQDAYETLTDKERRKEYDAQMGIERKCSLEFSTEVNVMTYPIGSTHNKPPGTWHAVDLMQEPDKLPIAWLVESRSLKFGMLSNTYITIFTNTDESFFAKKVIIESNSYKPDQAKITVFFRDELPIDDDRKTLSTLQYFGKSFDEWPDIEKRTSNPVSIHVRLDHWSAIMTNINTILRPALYPGGGITPWFFEFEHTNTYNLCRERYDHKPFSTRMKMWGTVMYDRMRCSVAVSDEQENTEVNGQLLAPRLNIM